MCSITIISDDFITHENDKIVYKQFGNAVNVDVVHLVIKKHKKNIK